MSPEAQRIAIAEVCGWNIQKEPLGGVFIYRDENDNMHAALPNYLNDLNAMHEAEQILKPLFQPVYNRNLLLITRMTQGHGSKKLDNPELFVFATATARQRAEAFLRTIGKWE